MAEETARLGTRKFEGDFSDAPPAKKVKFGESGSSEEDTPKKETQWSYHVNPRINIRIGSWSG